MNKIFFTLIAALLIGFQVSAQLDRTQPPKAGPAPTVNIGDYSTFSLNNGLKVIVVENSKTPVISWQLSLDIDPVMEGEAKGYVDMAGQLMRSGTKNRTKQQIDEAIDFIGASLSTTSSGMFASSLTRHKEQLLQLMSDVLLHPTFPQEELDKSIAQAISGLSTQESDANAMANNLITRVVYGNEHPYGEVMTKESVGKINRDHLVNYYNTFFKPNAAYLVIVGDISLAEAKSLTQKYFGTWERGSVPTFSYTHPASPSGNKVAFANREGALQSVLAVTYPIDLTPGSPDAIPASVMNSVLGGGVFSGRLMQNLREDKAYTYGARSSLSGDKLVGRFTARTEVGNIVSDSALVEILYEMDRLVKEPIDQPTLDLVKNFMNGNFARSLESPRTIANFALNIERYNLPKDYYKNYLENLAAVSIGDVSAMAAKYIKPSNAWIVVGGNKGETAEKLTRFASDGEVHFFDAYGRKLEASGAVIPEGMTAAKVVENYINAVGGRNNLKAVTDQTIKMSTSMQGMSLEMVSMQKAPDKVVMTTSMGGNVLQKQVFDGTRGKVTAMGQSMELSGSQLEDMRAQARLHIELEYQSAAFSLELLEIEDVDGKPTYKVQITPTQGASRIEYYDLASGLKVRSVSSQETPMGPVSVATSYSDYREVQGVKYPFSIKQQAGPQNIDLKVESVLVNSGLSDDHFVVQ